MPQHIRIFISTGEVSGDLQGALLIEALQRQAQSQDMTLEISALGGQRMAAAGAELIADTTAIGSVGIFEAIPYLLPTYRIQRQAQQVLQQRPPDLAVLIDYMNPNMVMGQFLKDQLPQVPVTYYIAPQQWVWAFSTKDTERIVGNCDRMLSIFPAEAEYFKKFGASVRYVGHPLVDSFLEPPDRTGARQRLGLGTEQPVVALLPASRRQEVKYLLPAMFVAAQQLQQQVADLQFVVPVSSAAFQPVMAAAVERYGLRATVVQERPREAIAAADVVVTKSGTANLEIALMDIPQVVTYRINPVSAWIVEHVLKFPVPFVSPVNLVEMQPVVPELLQWRATPEAIAAEVITLLNDAEAREVMRAGYRRMRDVLGEPGACDRTAQEILQLLKPTEATHP